MSPIPIKLREAVLRARADRFSYAQIAAMLGIGYATVNRILRLHRETASLVPRPKGGGNVSPIHGELSTLLAAIIAETPDATVAELTDVFMARSGIATSRSAVQRALGRMGYSRKKRPSLPPSGTRPNTVHAVASSARS